jgi:hypothetical protein
VLGSGVSLGACGAADAVTGADPLGRVTVCPSTFPAAAICRARDAKADAGKPCWMPALYLPTKRLSAAVCCEVDELEALVVCDASADGAGWAAGAIDGPRVEIEGDAAAVMDDDMTDPLVRCGGAFWRFS